MIENDKIEMENLCKSHIYIMFIFHRKISV